MSTTCSTAKIDELVGFSDTVLASVAQFLTKTEHALSATRIMVEARLHNMKFNTQLKQSYEWDIINFEDIDKALTKKLTGEDIGGVLVCTDAINTIEVFELKGCIIILGHGLEPLRGSRTLELLDLCPVSHKQMVLLHAKNGIWQA